ncbi:helix-turn-helix transcriptional regulator [Sphaerisporangium rhizosphaerae]|uniref:Helix-turn-helix transcriptional regulator n=1 Tax=Sphaerisporangium rhizosphaerae TaxID=2269375 RepID=A0ABW2NZQ3_9ACTN
MSETTPRTSDPYRTTDDVATRYCTSPSTVRYWRHAGIGPRGVKIGRRVLYRESELMRWERERDAEQNGGTAVA